MLTFVVILIAIALVFDYINGFHDAANSIATIVSTRVLTPGKAVVWAAFFNFVAAFGFGVHVAKTMGKGLVDLHAITPEVILAGLIGAILWDLITWYLGLPTSSSHALIGGYAGAAATHAGFGAIIWSGWTRTIAFIVIAPTIGIILGFLLMLLLSWILRRSTPTRVDGLFRKLQLVSAGLYSLGHGTNDAQKTMGIIAGVLYISGYMETFAIPFWVVLICHGAIALGTLSGGWRIVKTMGMRITQLRPWTVSPRRQPERSRSSGRHIWGSRSRRPTRSPERSSAWVRSSASRPSGGGLRHGSSGRGCSRFLCRRGSPRWRCS